MNKATPAPHKEVTIGPTAHGGVYKVAYYFNSKYACVPKEEATRIIIHEYDEKDRSIFRDYISCGPDDEAEYAAMEALEHADKPQPIASRKKPQEIRVKREERQPHPVEEKAKTQERRRREERSRTAKPAEEKKRTEQKTEKPRRDAQKRNSNNRDQKPPRSEQKPKAAPQQAEGARRPEDAKHDVKRRRRRPPRRHPDSNRAPRPEKAPE